MSLRILDANLNRAREGLRTCEEYARLELNDARAAAAVKKARRLLQGCSDLLGPERLLAARDISGDVATVPRADDVQRRDSRDIAQAAIKRAQEALRTVEEFSQLEIPQAAAAAAQARYAAYEAEQQLFVAAPRRVILRDSRVMVIFTRRLCASPWRDVLAALTDAGARLFQLREKDAEAGELAAYAREFAALAPDAALIINDRADIAALCQAGVHCGQRDLSVADARRVAGPAALIGVSTHNVEEAIRAEADGADYIGLGAMFATGTKDVEFMAGPGMIKPVLERVSLPVFPIGGITPENVRLLKGARSIAASGAILQSSQPADVYRALQQGLEEGR